ncbi:MAG: TRAP transporter large permease subunit, partial [Burkholderiales bacterium]
PTLFGEWLTEMDFGLTHLMIIYVVVLIILGTVLDTASIILIAAPLFLPAVQAFGGNLVWFGVVTVIGAEIGLLTPPLGLSVFTVKSAINDPDITLHDIFAGAFPFAMIMLLVLIAVIAFPGLSLALL